MTFIAKSYFLTPNHNTFQFISIYEHTPNYFLNINMIVTVKIKTHNEDVEHEMHTFNHLHATSRLSELVLESMKIIS